MTSEVAMWLAGFAMTVIASVVAIALTYGKQSNRLDVIERDMKKSEHDIDRRFSEMKDADMRDDTRVLQAVSKLEGEMREGFVYLGGGLANLSITLSDHEFRLGQLEKAAGVSSKRMPAVRPPPRPPAWMPASAQMPIRTPYDPEKDPRSR